MFGSDADESAVARMSGSYSRRLLGHPALQKFDWSCMDEREWFLLAQTWHATWGQAAKVIFPGADQQHGPALVLSEDRLRRLPAGSALDVALLLRDAAGLAEHNSLTAYLAVLLKANHQLELSFSLGVGIDREAALGLNLSSDWSLPFCGSRALIKAIPTSGVGITDAVTVAYDAVFGALVEVKAAFDFP